MSDAPAASCPHREPVSPENADCAWCARFRINLDRAGRLCARCAADAAFHDLLTRQAAVRFGPDCGGATHYCDLFDTVTDPAQCSRCKTDPATRAFLNGQRAARTSDDRRRRTEGCAYRSETLRTETRSCCGGEVKTIAIFRCTRLGKEHPLEAHEGRCAECPHHVPQQPNSPIV